MTSNANFLDQFSKLPTPDEMRQWDQTAIEFGIPEIMLMENAGQQLSSFFLKKFCGEADLKVCLFMGKGNNGGDAACMARHLVDSGCKCLIFNLEMAPKPDSAANWHMTLARKNGVLFQPIPDKHSPLELKTFFLQFFYRQFGSFPTHLVDGLLGTGLASSLRPELQDLIQAINDLAHECNAYMLSIDVPSGLNGETGQPSPVCVRAVETVTLEAPKTGLINSRQWTGKLYLRKIGMPQAISEKCAAHVRLLSGKPLLADPETSQNTYKNFYGHVFVFGGAAGMTGAAHLASLAALRAGAGLVTACAPAQNLGAIKNCHSEIMTEPVSETGTWPDAISSELANKMQNAACLVIGPGMGRSQDSAVFLHALLALPKRPSAIIDADALYILGKHKELFSYLNKDDILTPHPGEAGFLLGKTSAQIQKERRQALASLIELTPAVAVLKGAFTLIGQKDQPVFLSPWDIPALAIAGAGDVLAGLLAGLAAQKIKALEAAVKGVLIHALAGLMLQRKYPNRGGLAGDLCNLLPFVREFIRGQNQQSEQEGIIPWPVA